MTTRVLSVRFTDEEYKLLQSMSLVTGKPVNAIVRDAVSEKADRAVQDPEFLDMADETKRRIEQADAALRQRVAAAR